MRAALFRRRCSGPARPVAATALRRRASGVSSPRQRGASRPAPAPRYRPLLPVRRRASYHRTRLMATAAADLVGRDDELSAIAGFLEAGAPACALVIDGEPGVGKTTVWRGPARAPPGRR